MTYNKAAMTALLAWMEAGGDETAKLDMGSWAVRGACGTTVCAAGRTVVAAGWELDWADEWGTGPTFCERGGERVYIPVAAAAELGINEFEREILFAENSPFDSDAARKSTAFLRFLVKRAEAGLSPMEWEQVHAWSQGYEQETDEAA